MLTPQQLVIVGDQSAGKSSLLQSLTDIPFPVGGRLCTRFPTRIISRRTPDASEKIQISIERRLFSAFVTEADANRNARYEAFTRTIPTITARHFSKVVEEVSTRSIIYELPPKGATRQQKSWESKHQRPPKRTRQCTINPDCAISPMMF